MKKSLIYLSFIFLFVLPLTFLLSSCEGGESQRGDTVSITFPEGSGNSEGHYSSSIIEKKSDGSTVNTHQTSPAKIGKGNSAYLIIVFMDEMYTETYDMDTFKVLLDGQVVNKTLSEENMIKSYQILIEQEISTDHTITYDLSGLKEIMVDKSFTLAINQFNWYVRNDLANNGKESVSWASDASYVEKWDIQYMIALRYYEQDAQEPSFKDYFNTGYKTLSTSDLTYDNNTVTVNFQVPKFVGDIVFLVKARYDEKNVFEMTTSKIKKSNESLFCYSDDELDEEGYSNYILDLSGNDTEYHFEINCPDLRSKFRFECSSDYGTILLLKTNCTFESINTYHLDTELKNYKYAIEQNGYYLGQTLEFKAYPWVTNRNGENIPYDGIVNYEDAYMSLNGIDFIPDGLKYTITLNSDHLTSEIIPNRSTEQFFDLVLEGLKPKDNARLAKITYSENCIFRYGFGDYLFLPDLGDDMYIIPDNLEMTSSTKWYEELPNNYNIKLYINGELKETFILGEDIDNPETLSYALNYTFDGIATLPNKTGTDYIEIKFE